MTVCILVAVDLVPVVVYANNAPKDLHLTIVHRAAGCRRKVATVPCHNNKSYLHANDLDTTTFTMP